MISTSINMDKAIKDNYVHKHTNFIQPCKQISSQMLSHSVDAKTVNDIYNKLSARYRINTYSKTLSTYYWNNLTLTIDQDKDQECKLNFYKHRYVNGNLMYRRIIEIPSSITKFKPSKELDGETHMVVFGLRNDHFDYSIELIVPNTENAKEIIDSVKKGEPLEQIKSISYKFYLYGSKNIKKYIDVLYGR
jgi:hypothetical protein